MLFIKEIKYRKTNFILGSLGMIAAVAIVVLFFMMTSASQNETRILTRSMGFNLKIIPKSTNMNDFWIDGYAQKTMPDNYAKIISKANDFTYAHITATLHKKIQWKNKEIILTGLSPNELEATHKKVHHSKMIFAVKPGTVYIGYELAKDLKIKEGASITLLNQNFKVKKTLSEVGSNDDIRIYFDLKELQQLLKMEGRINEIMALNCVCSMKSDDPINELRTNLERILPNAKVIMNRTIAVARERQRKMLDHYFSLLLPIFLIICALWIGIFTMLNIMQRRTEIGLLRSLGFNSWKIARLLLYRSIFIGLIGAILGFFLATGLGITYGPDIFKITARSIHPNYSLFYYSIILAPLFSIIAGLLPIVHAITQDPAEILKES